MIAERPFAFLAADMGTGKTAAAIVGLRGCDRLLVVCPIAVGPAWVKQLGLWDDTGREVCLAVDGTAARRAKAIAATGKRCVVVVNYDAVWRGEVGKAIAAKKWNAIVLDESHKIKSPSGRASKWLAKLAEAQPKAKRVCLTGTPTPHSPLDWWAQARFLDPELLGKSFTAYRRRIAVMHPRFPSFVLEYRTEALEALAKRLDPHVYRIKADDVLTLPDLLKIELPVSLPASSRDYYDRLEEHLIATLETGETVTAANKLVVVTRLQQATSGYAVDESGEVVALPGGNPKEAALQEWLEGLPPDEPVVIFCKFIHDIDTAKKVLRRIGRSHSELSGRKKSLDQWQRGDTIALVVQQQAGGVGVDCTRAAYACYFSLSHSLGDYDQSLARLRRPGQTRPCRFYHLVAENTVDGAIYEALRNKRDVTEAVLNRLQRRVVA
jgi:SNF2 family DNA or RNA helicase